MVQDFSASFAVEILGNNLAGWLKLRKFSTSLKWSKIGKLHMNLIQVYWNNCDHLFSLLLCILIWNWMKLNNKATTWVFSVSIRETTVVYKLDLLSREMQKWHICQPFVKHIWYIKGARFMFWSISKILQMTTLP